MKRGIMIINITCPNCNFSKQIASEKIPAGIKNAKCPRCSKTFEIPGMSEPEPPQENPQPPEPLHQEPIQEVAPPPLPDKVTDVSAEPVDMSEPQNPYEEGYFTGLWRVFSGVLFSPTEFFRWARDTGIKDSMMFGILTGSIGVMFSLFWEFHFLSQEGSYLTKLFPQVTSFNDIFLGMIICSPLIVLVNGLIVTAVVHACLSIIGGASKGFEGTFKVMLYSNAVSVFSLVPYLGGYVAFFWSITIIVKGLREIHETSNAKAVFSLALPVIFLMILSAFAAAYLAIKLV
jgi:predicted Zn finger-like uncharacterized protein